MCVGNLSKKVKETERGKKELGREGPREQDYFTTPVNNNISDEEQYFGYIFDAGLCMGDENTLSGMTEGMHVVMKG